MIRSDRSPSLRVHPKFLELFKQAEGRFFSDDELNFILSERPDLGPEVATARAVRPLASGVVKRVVTEIFAQYDYEKLHELALAKCPRDVNYVVAYATQAMLAQDLGWLDDKLLIWLKTILQAFDFPERTKSAVGALFADKELEDNLAKLPKKTRSIYHTYYRLEQEMQRELSQEQFAPLAPFLQLTLDSLTEAY